MGRIEQYNEATDTDYIVSVELPIKRLTACSPGDLVKVYDNGQCRDVGFVLSNDGRHSVVIWSDEVHGLVTQRQLEAFCKAIQAFSDEVAKSITIVGNVAASINNRIGK